MSNKGTNNRVCISILKDKLKQFLFVFSRNKYLLRQQLYATSNRNDHWEICNQILGVHQNKKEIISFVELIKRENFEPEVLIEIGTANGGNNLFLATCFPSVQVVIGIDLYVKNRKQIKFYLPNKAVHTISASSYSMVTIQKVKKIIGTYKKGIVFIDGDHWYEGVRADFEAYKDMFTSNTCIAFHDIVPDDFLRYGKETPMWVGDVPKFWKELKKQLNHTIEIIDRPDQNGLGIGVILPTYNNTLNKDY